MISLLLRDLHAEDLQLTARLEEANGDLNSEEISRFLRREQFPSTANFTQHPINVFHLIKKHTLATNNLLLRLGEAEVKERILELRNGTDLIRTLRLEGRISSILIASIIGPFRAWKPTILMP